MPETITSWLFWLFMFLRMGCFETRSGRSPALINSVDSLPFVVPSLREALQPFSAVVVTGGSSGIGRSFIELGATLHTGLKFCNLSRRPPAKNSWGKRLNHLTCDLSRAAEVEHGAGQVLSWLASEAPTGRILLINNSGIGAYGAFPEPNLERTLEMVDVNARAVVHLTGLLLPTLKARGGAIVTIASTVAFQPTAFAATYGATKAFVLHWSLALNEELRGTGVRTLAVCPGTTRTDFFRSAGLSDGAVMVSLSMSSEDVAEAILRALAAERSQLVPGWKNKVYTFLGSKLPKPLAARLGAKVLARFRLNKGTT
jgi:short-subunit dehydrogenase